MASSFFRGSCAIFWITWLIGLAYVLGVTVYESKYIILTDEYTYASSVVKLICFLVVCLAFVGCVFVKCDISHILCFLLYVIPLFVIIPCMCIYAILITKDVVHYTGDYILEVAMETWDSEGILPVWLDKAEVENRCCGVFTWKDYGLDIYKSSKTRKPAKPVPSSCCKDITTRFIQNGEDHCLNDTMILDFLVSKNESHQTKEQNLLDDKLYENRTQDAGFPYLNDKYKDLIYTQGCNSSVISSAKAIEAAHFTFMIILFIISYLMAIVYIKNWCGSRRFSGGRSDHSLDVETISLLDVTQAEPMLNILPAIKIRRSEVKPSDSTRVAPRASKVGEDVLPPGVMGLGAGLGVGVVKVPSNILKPK